MLREKIVDKTMKPEMESTPRAGTIMAAKSSQIPIGRTLPLAFVPPCVPTWSRHAPVGRDWVHEIKHDGYRLIVRRQAHSGAIVHAPQVRLEPPLSADRRGRQQSAG